ncbi:MAG: hypothetical protein K5745_00125 [Saccharofermentans sp.]|nr:hypothetical protein [Saccharofermentans sp.]
MTETYSTDVMSAKYIKEHNVVFIEFTKPAEGEAYRTPQMHVCEIARKRGAETVIADLRKTDISEVDIKWSSKVLMPAYENAGIKTIIYICGEDLEEEPAEFKSKLTIRKAKDYDEAISMLRPEKTTFTRKEALDLLGLKEDANAFAIDERFYQLTKRYRGKTDEESQAKLNELSEAYNTATGQRDKERREQLDRDRSKKFLGKTAGEWKTYFSYTWLRWVIVLIVLVIAGNLIYNIFIKGSYDCSVVAFGHFDFDGTYISDVLEANEYDNPYVASADVVVPNEEGQTENAYSDQTFSALLLSNPDVLITDEVTLPYYFNQYQDLSKIYFDLEDFVRPEVYDKLEPVYLSEAACAELMAEYSESQMLDAGEDVDMSEVSYQSIMVGIRISDPEIIAKLGFTTRWTEQDPDLVIAIYAGQDDLTNAENVLITILNKAV